MKIYLYYNKQISIFNLPESVSGSYSFDVDEEEVSKLINIDAENGRWILFATEDCKIMDNMSYVKRTPLTNDKFYVISRNGINYLIYVVTDEEQNKKIYNYSTTGLDIRVGIENATATYTCPYIKGVAFQIHSQENQILLEVVNGNVYVNHNEVLGRRVIKSGDEVELFGVKLMFVGDKLIVFSTPNILNINYGIAGLSIGSLQNIDPIENKEVKDKNLYDEDSYFSKSPRIRRIIEKKKFELSQPPHQGATTEMPFLLTIGPMLTMSITSLVMIASPLSQLIAGTAEFSQVAGIIITSVFMMISSLLWPILIRRYNKKQKAKMDKKTREKYQKYLKEKKQELESERKLQKEIIEENVISIGECIENLRHKKLNFWDKRIDQNDFLQVRLGIGNEPLKIEVNYPKEGFTTEEDDLKDKITKLLEEYKYIPNVPISYSFYENKITAIMGPQEKSHTFMDNILIQLLTFYSYDDLKIVVFTNEKNKNHWDYIKYLNHNMTNDSSFRFFASTEDNATIVSDVLKQEINGRLAAAKDNNDSIYRPYYFMIIDDVDIIKKTDLIDILSECKVNIGFSIVFLESKLSKLPSLCNNFINVAGKTSGILKNSYEKQEQIAFEEEQNPQVDMMEVSRVLANIPIEITSNNESFGDLPDSITFLEMAKVGKVEQLNILNRWNTNDSTTNLKAEVGVTPEGKLMYLDLHEKAHGPHGLIAGMTGSGKSEFIITWILSLSMNFSPEDVAFILIDYKGGGLAFAFENQVTGVRLPHLTGTITNLDKAEIDRTLISIDSEVKRRQRIFNEARDKLGESTIDIYKYQGFYHEGKLTEPLPHLFIVCDEFAELKAQQPDFMDNLISVARIGRSLGVHLILATQKPSGVVNDQIWSNTKFRVCLKVQDASDSNEMLKRPDAASLKQTGRFYLQVGYDEYFALGQSGWCGAKYYPSEILQKTVDKSVNFIDETGISIKNIQSGNNNAQKVAAEGEQLAAIMNEIIKVAKQSNKFAKRLWLENIKEDITIDEVEQKYHITYEKNNYDIVIGEYDAPELQQQYPLTYNILKNGNANIISTDSQETEELFSTLLYNVMKHYTPQEVTYFVIDYGSQNFLKHRKSPHCGGIVSPGDNEQFNNLFKLISEEQRNRKKILSEQGIEYVDYMKEHPNEMPIMLIIFNNYESIFEANQVLYDIMGEYLRDSERYGIVYLIGTTTTSGLSDRIKQSIPFTLALKLKDPSDYYYCFGNKGKKEPKNLFGRGICYNDAMHEFQTAFICKNRQEENQKILDLFAENSQKEEPTTLKIPTLPEQVVLKDVEKKLKSIKKIPVGIEKGTLAIKTFDLTVEIGKLVITNKLKYTNNFILSFLDECIYLRENIIVLDPTQSIEKASFKIKNYFTNDFDNKIDKIMEFLDNQKEVKDKNTIIVIHSISKLLNKLETKSKIDDFFSKCKEVENAFMVIVDENAKLKEFMYEDWFRYLDVSEGVYIGPGVEEQNLLRINTYSKELSQKLPNNYGYYIAEGGYNIIKLIEFEKMEEFDDDED